MIPLCRILGTLHSPSNHIHCHCLGLNFSNKLELHRGSKVYSNNPEPTNNLPIVAFNDVVAPCEETSLVLCNYTSWLKIRLIVLAMSWDNFVMYGPAKCSLYYGSSNCQFSWQLEIGTSRKYTDLEQDNVYMWYVQC